MMNNLESKMNSLEKEVKELQCKKTQCEEQLENLKNEILVRKTVEDWITSGNDLYRSIRIISGCNTNEECQTSWTNILLNEPKPIKYTIKHPLSLKFNIELKKLISKYVFNELSEQEINDCINTDEIKSWKIKKLNDDLFKLNNDICDLKLHIEKFNSLPWYKKIFYKFNL